MDAVVSDATCRVVRDEMIDVMAEAPAYLTGWEVVPMRAEDQPLRRKTCPEHADTRQRRETTGSEKWLARAFAPDCIMLSETNNRSDLAARFSAGATNKPWATQGKLGSVSTPCNACE